MLVPEVRALLGFVVIFFCFDDAHSRTGRVCASHPHVCISKVSLAHTLELGERTRGRMHAHAAHLRQYASRKRIFRSNFCTIGQ